MGAVRSAPQAGRSSALRSHAPRSPPPYRCSVGPQLRERGLLLVSIDVIDGWLTEINVTSPTGIRAVKNVGGPDVAKLVWDKIEGKVSRAWRRGPNGCCALCTAGGSLERLAIPRAPFAAAL